MTKHMIEDIAHLCAVSMDEEKPLFLSTQSQVKESTTTVPSSPPTASRDSIVLSAHGSPTGNIEKIIFLK